MTSIPAGRVLRVVSVLPSATEMLCFLGGRHMLVGRSHEDNFPADVATIPIVTGQLTSFTTSMGVNEQVSCALSTGQSLYTINEKLIRELRPDVILTQDICSVCAIDLVTVERLAATLDPKPLIVSLDPMNLGDVLANLTQIGGAVGLEREARDAIASLEARIDRARATADAAVAAAGGRRRNVAFVEWPDPVFVGGHWTPQLIRLAGGAHPLNPSPSDDAGGGKSFAVEMSTVVESRPELLVVAPCGLNLQDTRRELQQCLERQSLWNGLDAVVAQRVALVDGDAMFNRPGPRLVDALEWLTWLLHDKASPFVGDGPDQATHVRAEDGPFASFPWETLSSARGSAPAPVADAHAPGLATPVQADIEDLISGAHAAAVRVGHMQYVDAKTGYNVFTELASINRGFCCGNGCRHCPYAHIHVPPERRKNRIDRSILLRVARDAAAVAAGDNAWREASGMRVALGCPALELVALDGSELANRALASVRAEGAAVVAVCFLRDGTHGDQLSLGGSLTARAAMDAADCAGVDLLAIVVPSAATGEADGPAAAAERALAALAEAAERYFAPASNAMKHAIWLPACDETVYPHLRTAIGLAVPRSAGVELCEVVVPAAQEGPAGE